MSGSLRMPPGARPGALPAIPRRPTPSWARPDPVDELAERLDAFVAAAVHPDEIAALLESDGLSDDQIRERYGVKNSFALAEELYERVGRRCPEPAEPVHDPWRVGPLGCLLRGVVFALPGFGYVLGAPLLAGPEGDFGLPAGMVPLLAGALFGWTWNQGLAHRAYSWLGLGDRPAARRSLLLGGPVGALLGALVALAVAGTAGPAAVVFAAGQSCYLGAATALLVLGRERALLAALSPMTAGAVLALARPVPDTARLVLLLGSLIAVAVLALREVAPSAGKSGEGSGSWTAGLTALLPFGALAPREPGRTPAPRRVPGLGRSPAPRRASALGRSPAPRPTPAPRPASALGRTPVPRPTPGLRRVPGLGRVPGLRRTPAPSLTRSLPYALFGLGSGVLVLYAALGDVPAGEERAAVAAPAAVALTLSMGPAEWLLYRFRSGSLAGLRSSSTPRVFRRAISRTAVACLAAYLAALLALDLVIAALWPHDPGLTGIRLAALLLLGVVMWTGLLLQSFGAVSGAALICVLAALAQTLALAGHTGGPHIVGVAVYGAAAVAQSALVYVLLGRATAHR